NIGWREPSGHRDCVVTTRASRHPLDHMGGPMAEQKIEWPTIMVMDDELAIQNLASRILTNHGFIVLEPRHAVHALQLCKQHQKPIHLLLTDVLMPYMH